MKKFIINLLFFIILVVAFDYVCGSLSSYMISHSKGGSTQNNYYIANKMESDVIIMGSSRATHHYVPSVIEDLTGFTCYNCGEEGNGSILAYGRFKMATDRYTPKIIIYEVTPEYDYFKDIDNSKYLKYLKPYYSNSHVRLLIEKFGNDFDNIKLLSKMYQNNGLFLTEFIDNIIARDNNYGYSPLMGKMNLKSNLNRDRIVRDIDESKTELIERLISECKDKGVNLFFFISPRYNTIADEDYFNHAISIAENNDIPLYDFRGVTDIAGNPKFFNDPLHMNNDGAMYYTQHYVSQVLKEFR